MIAIRRAGFSIAAAVSVYRVVFPCEAEAKAQKAGVKNERPGVLKAIGNTPLIELKSLSKATGCTILAKCEHLNPGGSVKDRAALWMVEKAEKDGRLSPGGVICEGTGGNTGVGLALVAAAKGYQSIMAMPASIAQEKIDAMKIFGASVILTPSVPFTDKRHYFHTAKRAAAERKNGFFPNQFDNEANYQAHLEGTAPEIWAQTQGSVDGFVASAGTGGTISGCSQFFKAVHPECQVYLIDPPGSGYRGYVLGGPFADQSVEGESVRFFPRSKGSSVTEGIGIGRLTANFAKAKIDGAFTGSDEEAIEMAYHLKEVDGVLVGPSAALNVVGAVKLARKLGPGKTVVTVLCDSGDRYKSKLFNEQWMREKGFLSTLERSTEVRRRDDALTWIS